MVIAINYADNKFAKAQSLNKKSALKWGADKVICYSPEDIDKDFYEKNKAILDRKRGNGYWLWKPYFLNKAYKLLEEGDYLIYTDSGSAFVNKIQYLIDCMEKEQTDIMVFSLELEMVEKKYTKSDAFILMGCDSEEYYDTPQSIGGYVVLKKSAFVENFLKEDLEYAQDSRIITDDDNVMGKDNASEFVAHRHDQSIWSLMSKKYEVKRFKDPSQYGIIHTYEPEVEKRSTYPQIIDSHRMSDVDSMWKLKIREKVEENKFYKKCKHKIYLYKKRTLEKNNR